MNILFYTHPFIALSIFLDVIILWSCQKLALQNKLNLMKLASTLSAHSVLNYHPWCTWKLRQLETTKQPPHISHNFKTKPIFFRVKFPFGKSSTYFNQISHLLRTCASTFPGAKTSREPQTKEPVATRPTTTVPGDGPFGNPKNGARNQQHLAFPVSGP